MGDLLRLTRTELRRLRWRRAVLLLVAAAIVIPGLVWATSVWSTRPYSDAEIQRAREQALSQPGFERDVARCERHPHRYGADSAADCEEQMVTSWSGLYRQRLSVAREVRGNGPGVVVTVAVLMLLAGATFAGADWASGSMSNQLLFDPRRTAVWVAKAVAVGLGATVVALVSQLLYWAGIYLVAAQRGIDPPAALRDDVAWLIARGSFVVALAAVGGFALTMLFRSTVATLGLLFAVAVAGTFAVAVLPLGGNNERYMVHANVNAVVSGQHVYWREPPEECFDRRTGGPVRLDGESARAFDERCSGRQVLSVWGGLGYLAVPTLLGLGLSIGSFRRRDVP
ncbi:hypothetical protein [Nocardioides sp.]|uniref:hypothetical protein n=1 Tax=Nocardioides sp. TaxID=35761 RepID=UPI003526D318